MLTKFGSVPSINPTFARPNFDMLLHQHQPYEWVNWCALKSKEREDCDWYPRAQHKACDACAKHAWCQRDSTSDKKNETWSPVWTCWISTSIKFKLEFQPGQPGWCEVVCDVLNALGAGFSLKFIDLFLKAFELKCCFLGPRPPCERLSPWALHRNTM